MQPNDKRHRFRRNWKKWLNYWLRATIIGAQIDYADTINTDARMLPCKVFESKTVDDKYTVLLVQSKNWFRGRELIDISSVVSSCLNAVDPSFLTEMTLIQLSQASTGWQNQAAAGSVFDCKGGCTTNRCFCKNAGVQCSTKCHSDIKPKSCKNVNQ